MKIDYRKLMRFMLAGGPVFIAAVPLNYLLVHWLQLNKAPAYAIVLIFQTVVNFFVCRLYVFESSKTLNLWKSFFVFFNGIALFRLGDWLVYVFLTEYFGLPYLGVQFFNVALFALLKFEFAKRVFEHNKPDK